MYIHPPIILTIIQFYQLLPSTTIHSILPVQILCLAIFLHNLSPHPLWSTPWSGALHLIFCTFLHPVSVFFLQHMPILSHLFCCSIKIILSVPSLSLNSLLGTTWNSYLYYNIRPHRSTVYVYAAYCYQPSPVWVPKLYVSG